jgi:hypothetical protein
MRSLNNLFSAALAAGRRLASHPVNRRYAGLRGKEA